MKNLRREKEKYIKVSIYIVKTIDIIIIILLSMPNKFIIYIVISLLYYRPSKGNKDYNYY